MTKAATSFAFKKLSASSSVCPAGTAPSPMATGGPGSPSVEKDTSLTLPQDNLRQLVKSIEDLTSSVKVLQQTIRTNGNTSAPGDAGHALTANNPSGDLFVDILERPDVKFHPWVKISVAKEHEIAMEDRNEIKAVRDILRTHLLSQNNSQFDSLKSLLADMELQTTQLDTANKTKELFSDDHNLHKLYGKKLIFALSRWSWEDLAHDPSSWCSGGLDMGPWASLILRKLSRSPHLGLRLRFGDDHQFKVLLELLRVLYLKSRQADVDHLSSPRSLRQEAFEAERVTLGDVFDHCYHRRVMAQPNENDVQLHNQHSILVLNSLSLLNVWRGKGWRHVPRCQSVHELRSLELSEVWQYSQGDIDMPSSLPKSEKASFQSLELCVEVLQSVGKLNIEWTDCFDDHLRLDVELSKLKIFWFGFSIFASPVSSLTCGRYKDRLSHGLDSSTNPMYDELRRTYSLLFRSQRDNYKANLRVYSSLPVPDWLHDGDGPLSKTVASNMEYFTRLSRPWLGDVEEHTRGLAVANPKSQLFERYRIFGDQLRTLKAYMDFQKPGGLLGLWRDKRDNLSWYTFWAIIIVGGFSLMLGFLSLAVSTAQTVAAFQSLHKNSDGRAK